MKHSHSKQILSGVLTFNYNKLNPLRQAGRVKTRFLLFLSPISIIHIDPCAFDVRTGLFVHFHTSKEFISVDLCYNDLRREEKKSRQHNRANWYNIHLLLRVSMLHNVTAEGSRGMMGAKRDRERELHSNEGMPGAVGWGGVGGTPGWHFS